MHVGNVTSCHADLYTVSRYSTRGESKKSVVRRRGSTKFRESTLGLKPRADVKNRDISGPMKRNRVPPQKIILKKCYYLKYQGTLTSKSRMWNFVDLRNEFFTINKSQRSDRNKIFMNHHNSMFKGKGFYFLDCV